MCVYPSRLTFRFTEIKQNNRRCKIQMIRPTLVRQAERLVNRNPLLYGPGPVARYASGIGAMVRRRTHAREKMRSFSQYFHTALIHAGPAQGTCGLRRAGNSCGARRRVLLQFLPWEPGDPGRRGLLQGEPSALKRIIFGPRYVSRVTGRVGRGPIELELERSSRNE